MIIHIWGQSFAQISCLLSWEWENYGPVLDGQALQQLKLSFEYINLF